jgi:carboxylesterase
LGFGDIDSKDLEAWDRVDGVIVGADSFELEGGNETCWIIIHGYTDSPDSMREISERVNLEFGDYVFAPRLLGHAEVPSRLLDYNLEDWYTQVSGDFERLEERCSNVNVLGFSFGGALSLRLAEEKKVKNVYLIAPYLKPVYMWYLVFSPAVYLDWFADSFVYFKKGKVAKINSPEGLKTHIAYWSFAFEPVKYSREFLEILRRDVVKVDEPILILHSRGDSVANYKNSEEIYERVFSEVKKIVLFEDSDHVILADYDRLEVIDEVLSFERENRG